MDPRNRCKYRIRQGVHRGKMCGGFTNGEHFCSSHCNQVGKPRKIVELTKPDDNFTHQLVCREVSVWGGDQFE